MFKSQILKRNAKDEPPIVPGLYCQIYRERVRQVEACQILISNILAVRTDIDPESLLKAAGDYATTHVDSFEMTLQKAAWAVQEGLKLPWEVA